jgi:superfamily I DNA/RNA helicase
MMTIALTAEQRAIAETPFATSLEIAGPSRSGKTTALRARIDRYAAECGANYLFAEHPCALVTLARAIFEETGTRVRIGEEIEAQRAFARAARDLFELRWTEFESGTIDPEVAALRSPQWFLEGAYRLIRKLRDGLVDPQTFVDRSLSGATNFYAKPPNFAHAELIAATKDAYRDSLAVSPEELQRQYRREVDLTKILHRLYVDFIDAVAESSVVGEADAMLLALDLARAHPEAAARVRERFIHVFVDEMQEATPAQRALLDAIYGTPLTDVTFAGDAAAATSRFRGARPEIALAGAAHTIRLRANPGAPAYTLHRAKTLSDEAAYVAERVREELERGVPPEEVAILFRSSADVHVYLDALLDRNIPAAPAGDVNLFTDRRALDALALLWNVWDPFAHAWLLRTLSGKAMALSDASVAILCADPPSPQVALFEETPEAAPTQRSGRWDPKRDIRLGWNVLRGESDAALNDEARERVQQFRALRAGWVDAMRELPLATFVRKVWSEGLAFDGTPDSARVKLQQHVLRELLDRLLALHRAQPEASLGDLLAEIGERAASDCERCAPAHADRGFVHLLNIDAARGRSFAFVAIPDARAGSFPRWYVPDSFLWSPNLGMIPRENAGSTAATRTAKFTYYLYRTKARDQYNAQERSAFEYALTRARGSVLVTACGNPTRGLSAPEFLEELRNAR